MKTQQLFQSLTQQLTYWGRRYKVLRRLYLSKINHRNRPKKPRVSNSMVKTVKGKNSIYRGWWKFIPQRTPVIFAIAIVTLTGVMGYKFYNQPQIIVGAIAAKTIYAPYTNSIEDRVETEAQRQIVRQNSLRLMVDGSKNEKIFQNLQQLLNEGNEIRAKVGSFPFFEDQVLSFSTQRYLRAASDQEWGDLLALKNSSPQSGLATKIQSRFPGFANSRLQPELSQNAEFIQALNELKAYRDNTSAQNLSALIAQIEQVRKRFSFFNASLSQPSKDKSLQAYSQTNLLDLSDEEWAQTQMTIQQTAQRIMSQGIHPGLPESTLEYAVKLHLQNAVPQNIESLSAKLLLQVLKPNIAKDEKQTQLYADRAASQVEPVMVKVDQGEVIVRKGEEISEWDLAVLEQYHLVEREINWQGLAYLGSAVTILVSIFAVVERRIKPKLRPGDRLLVLLLALSTPPLLIMGIPYTTWSAIGLLLSSFFGQTLGVTVVGLLLTLLLPMGLDVSKSAIVAGAAAGILGSCMAQRLRAREELAVLGIAIAFTEGGIYLIMKLLMSAAFGLNTSEIFTEAALLALSGLGWSIVALGLSPYLEKLFDLVTPIRLAELASPSRPLLKRLATEAPGTFQHTLFVATLAEAAAKELKFNVELVRAGTLYHDIGKMHDPLAFIENQMGGPNKHDTEIKDPWISAAIIKKHVSAGLMLARKHSLPSAIQAFIPEHQGKMQIAYFYHQAKEIAHSDPSIIVDEAAFTYEGPIPQSPETAIVMLADSCEAALRSLRDATPQKALQMVNNILRARWQENQLLDSGLQREDMAKIAEIFVRVWQQFHHKRIAYPKLKAGN